MSAQSVRITPAFMEWPIPQGVNADEYDIECELWQAGRCGICGVSSDTTARSHSLDHDHNTGLIRGMLCTRCNMHEGWQTTTVFHRWRTGMNPCATFGWHYEWTGPGYAPRKITPERATELNREALATRYYLRQEAREAMASLGDLIDLATT